VAARGFGRHMSQMVGAQRIFVAPRHNCNS
jgi:hypothetical protein